MISIKEAARHVQQCMGGFCLEREECEHYHAPARRGVEPAERLCSKEDGEASVQVRVLRGIGEWESAQPPGRPAQHFDDLLRAAA